MGKTKGRKKNTNIELDDDALSEHHTISGDSVESVYQADFDADTNSLDTDELLTRAVDTNHASAEAELENTRRNLQDILEILRSDFPTEKRTVQREAWLRRAFLTLASCSSSPHHYTLVQQYTSVIHTACRFSLQRGGAAERYASCRVLEVTSIVLGANEEEWVSEITTDRVLLLVWRSTSTAVRMASIRAMATAVAVCAASDRSVRDTWMDRFEDYGQVEYRQTLVPLAVRAAAWDAWALLATLLDDGEIAGEHESVERGRGVRVLESLRDCLDSSHPDLRSAAGQAAALIHEARLNVGTDQGNATARRFQAGSWEGSSEENTIYEIQQRMAELAVESGHRVSKKAKKAQRATFREYVATLVDDESPYETVHLRHGSLEVTSWKELIVLNWMRQSLQGGFQVQILTNGTLQDILHVEGSILSRSGAVEKRLVQSKASEASKLADQKLQGRRDKRENIKNHFLTADGQDI